MKHLLVLIVFACASLGFSQPTLHVLWDRSGAGDSSRYGYTILPLGDQNNDGYADWAVFALGGNGDAPLIEFFHGGNPMPTQPYMTQHLFGGDVEGAIRGVALLGDLNGDNYQDWGEATLGPIQQHTPMVISTYLGGPTADTIPDMIMTIGGQDGIGPIGDFNGDHFDDLYRFDAITRVIRVFYGASLLDTVSDWPSGSHPNGSQATPFMFGDLNSDGFSDYVSASLSANTTYIFLGGSNPDTIPAYTWPNMAHWPRGIVKDLNGDHFDDLIYPSIGGADVHFGGVLMSPIPSAALSFPCQGGANEVVSAGDFNHDGYNDLLMLTDYCADNDFGVLTIHLGHPLLNPSPAITIEGWADPLNLIGIWTAAGLGDVNGDGVDDIAIGAVNDIAYLGWRGRCVILAGDTTLRVDAAEPFIPHPSSLILSAFPNPFNPATSLTFTLPASELVTLDVYDVLGRLAFSSDMGRMTAGEHSYRLDGSAMASGVYFAAIRAGTALRVVKVALVR